MSIGNNYFGVNYNQHYNHAQGYRPSGQHYSPHPRPNTGYGFIQPHHLLKQLVRLILMLLNRGQDHCHTQYNDYNHCGNGGGYQHKDCGTGEGPTPKPAYFEGPPVMKVPIGPGEGPGMGKLVAGPGEGPGMGKLVAGPGEGPGPGKRAVKSEGVTEGPSKRAAKFEGTTEGPSYTPPSEFLP